MATSFMDVVFFGLNNITTALLFFFFRVIEWVLLMNCRKSALLPYSLERLPLTPSDSPSFLRHSVLPLIPTPSGTTLSLPIPISSRLSSQSLLPLPAFVPKKLSILPYVIAISSSPTTRTTMLERYCFS